MIIRHFVTSINATFAGLIRVGAHAGRLTGMGMGTGMGMAITSALMCLTPVSWAGDFEAQCAPPAVDSNLTFRAVPVQQDATAPEPAPLFEQLAQARVVVIGESHDQWPHHLMQLEVICQVFAALRDNEQADTSSVLAIGLEQFQRPAQQFLDAYIGDEIDLDQFLQKSRYFDLWGYDFRLYAPIIEWAHEHGVRLLALNASSEEVELARSVDFDDLSEAQRRTLPFEIEQRSDEYVERLKEIFRQHSDGEIDSTKLRRFAQVQQTWEATMAATAVAWLRQNEAARLVILAGAGHTIWPGTIPDLLRDQGIAEVVSVAMDVQDYLVEPAAETPAAEMLVVETSVDINLSVSADPLEPAGLMGVSLKGTEAGVVVDDFGETSSARDAGIRQGDRIVNINGQPITTYAEVRQQLWRSRAGDSVEVHVNRDGEANEQRFSFQLR